VDAHELGKPLTAMTKTELTTGTCNIRDNSHRRDVSNRTRRQSSRKNTSLSRQTAAETAAGSRDYSNSKFLAEINEFAVELVLNGTADTGFKPFVSFFTRTQLKCLCREGFLFLPCNN
jgi:hypothetical protein